MLPNSAFWQQREYNATITSNVENTDYASLFKVVTKWHEWVQERKRGTSAAIFLLHAHFSDCPNEREHTCRKRKDDAQDNRYSQYRMQDKQRHLFKLWPCSTLS